MSAVETQRSDMDCWLCCLAMALGQPYEVVLVRLGDLGPAIQREGTTGARELAALEKLDHHLDRDFKVLHLSPHWGSQKFIKNALWGRRAIIGALSQNEWNQEHAVYWDGTQLHDPSRRKRYETLDDVELVSVTLFKEVKL